MLRDEGSQAAVARKQKAEKARRMRERMSIDEGLEYVRSREERNQQMAESEAGDHVSSEEQSESERLREERKTKKRNDPIGSESEQGDFEIGINLVQEGGYGSPIQVGSDETESEEEEEEVNRLVDESDQEGNQDEPMEEAEPQEEEEELPMYQEHYNALFSMDFVEPSSPICELDRAELDQGWGWITFLARGERKALPLGSLRYCLGSLMEKEPIGNIKEDELQRFGLQSLMEYSSSRSKAAQIRSPSAEICPQGSCQHLLCKESHWTINEGEVKLLDMGIKPIISRTRDGKKIRGDRAHAGKPHASP
ncbi:unnamed protein product [Microthlaspi erraticum]|uniref:Arabidopsis retrotransposon Orf1 C-terminal domain-containing protein n=1 Tax=Microthlaspi erraticum TaxID=1685480 RepID=A0A6D2L022_9BRAS|nr:unnamed protein product [Microthlaspi erraticum]